MYTSIEEFKLNESFSGKVIATDKKHLIKLIKANVKHFGKECDLNYIDTSQVTDMSELFRESQFNGDISQWNVSNVTNMREMFYNSQFNGDISNWDVSNVNNMQWMFANSKFTGDINNWNVSNVSNMANIFLLSELANNNNLPEWYKK